MDFFPPNLNSSDLMTYALSMLETIQMAIIALVLSVIVAVPLSFMSSRNILNILIPGKTPIHEFTKRVIYGSATLIANIFRSINEIIWALIFVSAVGLGPMAGILALGVHTAGVLSKLLSEGNEAIDPGTCRSFSYNWCRIYKNIDLCSYNLKQCLILYLCACIDLKVM